MSSGTKQGYRIKERGEVHSAILSKQMGYMMCLHTGKVDHDLMKPKTCLWIADICLSDHNVRQKRRDCCGFLVFVAAADGKQQKGAYNKGQVITFIRCTPEVYAFTSTKTSFGFVLCCHYAWALGLFSGSL